MAYDSPFQLLAPKIVKLLSDEQNSMLRGMYIDCLAVLQGLLGRFSSSSVVQVFDDAAEVDRIIDGYLSKMTALFSVLSDADTSKSSLGELQADASLLSEFMIETARRNKRTAIELYSECVSPKRALDRQIAFGLVELYLSALATQYRVLRYPNTQPQTLQARG